MPTITRAQGYPSFKSHGLIEEKYSELLDKNLYARTYLPRVTSSKYIGQIKRKGDKITIAREPKIETEPYVAGKPYDIETTLESPFTMTVNRGLRWKQYYDEQDETRTHVNGLNTATINAAANAIAKDIETEFLGEFPDMVPTGNKGNDAGVISGKYKLGTAASPIALSFANVIEYLMQFTAVLDETDVSNESGQRSILIPTIVGHYLKSSEKLLDASKIGGASSLKTQQLTTLPGIGTIYVSNLLPKLDNGAFPIVCMTKEAINFVIAARKTRIINDLDMYDGTLLRGYAIYDWGVARKEGLALGYATPSQTAIASVA